MFKAFLFVRRNTGVHRLKVKLLELGTYQLPYYMKTKHLTLQDGNDTLWVLYLSNNYGFCKLSTWDLIISFFSLGNFLFFCWTGIIVILGIFFKNIWCSQGCEREVAEAADLDSIERKKESIMRLSWALVHSRNTEDVERGIAMLEGKVDF